MPCRPVLGLLRNVEESYAGERRADGAGAVGYLLKDRVADPPDFVAQVKARAEVAPRSTRRWSGNCSHADAPTTHSTSVPRASARCWSPWPRGCRTPRPFGALAVTDGATEKHVTNSVGKLDLRTAASGNPACWPCWSGSAQSSEARGYGSGNGWIGRLLAPRARPACRHHRAPCAASRQGRGAG